MNGDDTPAELSERVAVQWLERSKSVEAFLAFVKAKKLSGKQRPYCAGFPKYAADGWDSEAIARDLRAKATHKASVESINRSQGHSSESSAGDATILEQVSKAKQNAERTAIVAALNSTHWNRKKRPCC